MEERIVTSPDDYASPALREIVSRLGSSGRKVVLDLGRPSSENVQFFSSRNCKLFISDFFDCLSEEGAVARQGRSAFRQACSKLLSFPQGTTFDYILAWDLLNYLSMSEVEVLTEHLLAYCTVGTRMMALVSIYQRIPDEPFRFFAVDEERVRYESATLAQRESPRHKESDLLHGMVCFEVETSLLLRHGMREYGFIVTEDIRRRAVAKA